MAILAKVSIPNLSGMPEDTVTNTWAIKTALEPTPDDYSDIHFALAKFYNEVPAAQTYSVSNFFSGRLSRVANACQITQYYFDEVGTPEPLGAPNWMQSFTIDAKGSSDWINMPDEVACCLSFAADLDGIPESVPGGPAGPEGDTRPRSRRRGRVFLGPLNAGAVTQGSEQTVRPSTDLVSTALAALGTLNEEIDAMLGTFLLGVFSRTDWDVRPITSAWIDNAFDTQRRRGQKPTSRTTVLL
jgi:hypothetical protein